MRMRTRHGYAAIALGAALAFFGCGGGTDDGGGSGGGSSAGANDYINRYAETVCNAAGPCCTAAGEAHEIGACKLLIQFLSTEWIRADHYDAAAGEQCLTELKAKLAACDDDEPEVCDRVFTGNQLPGQPCNDLTDCQVPASGESVTCDYDPQVEGSKCKVVVPPADGQPCDQSSDTEYYSCTFDPSFSCDFSTDTCEKRVALGADCSSKPCDASGQCDSATQVCVPRAAIGASCTFDNDCVEEAYCDLTNTCQKLKAVGEPCTNYNECAGFCDGDTDTCAGGGFDFCVTSD